jgi:hypothetical protein
MQTDELIRFLANGVEPVAADTTRRRVLRALGAAVPVTMFVMLLALGVQPALAEVATLPMFWFKLVLPLVLALAASTALVRLGRPGARLGRVPWLVGLSVLAVWIAAGLDLGMRPPGQRLLAVLGGTWEMCSLAIAGLSVPVFVASLWALRGLAPTRLRLAGAAAGLLAGAVSAFVYAFHCPELAVPFIAVWYVLGIAIPGAFGAAFGPRLLHWP